MGVGRSRRKILAIRPAYYPNSLEAGPPANCVRDPPQRLSLGRTINKFSHLYSSPLAPARHAMQCSDAVAAASFVAAHSRAFSSRPTDDCRCSHRVHMEAAQGRARALRQHNVQCASRKLFHSIRPCVQQPASHTCGPCPKCGWAISARTLAARTLGRKLGRHLGTVVPVAYGSAKKERMLAATT